LHIAKKLKCSRAAAYRGKPAHVVRSKHASDLCVYCEALRRAGVKLSALSRELGCAAVGDHDPLTATQREVRGDAAKAAAYLTQRAPVGEEAASLLARREVLLWHSALCDDLAAKHAADVALASAQAGTWVVLFDFMSHLRLESARGTSHEFYDQTHKVSILNMQVAMKGGSRSVDVICKDSLRHGALNAHTMLRRGARELFRLHGTPSRIIFWADCGKHFRCRETLWALLFEHFADIADVSLCFHGEHHGKSLCDQRFNVISQAAKRHVANWSKDNAISQLRQLLQKGACVVVECPAPAAGERRFLLNVRRITAHHAFRRQGTVFRIDGVAQFRQVSFTPASDCDQEPPEPHEWAEQCDDDLVATLQKKRKWRAGLPN
jgi:hypothetical protein